MEEDKNQKNEVGYCGICGCKFEIDDLVEVSVTAQGKSQADEAIDGKFAVKACGMCLQCLLMAIKGGLEMLSEADKSMEGWKCKSISGEGFKDTQIIVDV